MIDKLKKYETIAACGIDCGLCPRFYTKGNSACPGCGGLNFKEKHPSCGILTCCVIKNGFETCAECKDFPCSRFKTESAGYARRNVCANLEVCRPPEPLWNPRLREAATTLQAMPGQNVKQENKGNL